MKRVFLAIVGTVASLVLLLSFKTHSSSALVTPPAAVSSTGTSSSAGSGGGSSSTGPATVGAAKTYTGAATDTRFGPVQVRITVKNGKMTSAQAIDYPTTNPRDAQINAYAIPALNSEASSASSANIDLVSGATYTSQGYISSLQSALDKAGL